MSINELRNTIHDMVNKSDNQQLLELISNLFSLSEFNKKTGTEISWESFSDSQKELIMESFTKSNSDDELLTHKSVITNFKNEL